MNDFDDNYNQIDLPDEETYCDSGMFSFGKYEILFASAPYLDENGEYDGYSTHSVIQEINGADVKYSDTGLQYNIDWKEKGKSINSISFTMPRDDAKLGHIFETSPYGLIKKNRTGVGATTLELESPRNSIVVVPTKALAITKAKKSKIAGTEKYKYLYVASDSNSVGFSSIQYYLRDRDIIYKKFIVVADSLPKVLNEIGEQNYSSYFLMVDEIDSYQYDSSYRDSLENVIDYYFKFPKSKRCLVSATVGNFSNKKIKEEPVINVNFNDPQPRDINLIHTNNIIWTTVKQILDIRQRHPDDNILIAYNSVKGGILQIIESIRNKLKEQLTGQGEVQVNELIEAQLQNECAVLCSVQSKRKVTSYYSDIEGEQLPKKINFMTCSYFVGIDISERFHLISIADSNLPYTLLSEDKFLQIAGRCRDDEGLLSETIIYQSMQRDGAPDLINDFELEEEIKKDAFILADYLNYIPQVAEKFPLLYRGQNKTDFENFENMMIKNSLKAYYGTAKVKLVRKDIAGVIRPTYLNIDNIIIQHNLLNNLYFSINNLHQSLMERGNNVTFQNIIEESPERISAEIRERIDSYIRSVEQTEMNEIIEQLRPATSIEESISFVNNIKRSLDLTKNGQIFVDRFLELKKYVPFEQLVSKLPNYQYDEVEYNKFYDSVIFWALSDEHPFKIAFREKFPLNTYMTNEQVVVKSNELLMSFLGLKELDTIQSARKRLNILCENGRSSSRDPENSNPYVIRSYDVNSFNTTPSERISATIEIHKVFKFLKK